MLAEDRRCSRHCFAGAKLCGVSASSVQRTWRSQGLQPNRVRQFKPSNDPQFAAKLRDVVGLFVHPPGLKTPKPPLGIVQGSVDP
jgi:hypothetical protein